MQLFQFYLDLCLASQVFHHLTESFVRQLITFAKEECEAITTSAIESLTIKLVTVKFFLIVYLRGVLSAIDFAIFKCIVKETCAISCPLHNDIIFIVL